MNRKYIRLYARLFLGLALALQLGMVLALALLGSAHAQAPAAAARYRADLARAAHTQWGLNAPVAVLAAQVHQESGWNRQAVSQVGAAGLAQFMPATASWWCERTGTGAAACLPNNPSWALRALVGYDKYLYDLTPTHYSERDRMWVALRGYNGGLGHWKAEAASSGLAQPSRAQVDAACGKARRAAVHCPENLGYPRRILLELQPRYRTWGRML
jgi:soluble lytic murein transglycosylase-like protein